MGSCDFRQWLHATSLLVIIGALPLGLFLRHKAVDPRRVGPIVLLYLALSYGVAAALFFIVC